MYCKNCGRQINDSLSVCPYCNGAVTPKNPDNNTYRQYNYQYANQNYCPNGPYSQQEYNNAVSKGEDSGVLAVIGIIIGALVSPVIGFVLGLIALNHAKFAYSYTGNMNYKRNTSTAGWAVGVSAAVFVLRIVIVIAYLCFFGIVMSGV